jgi:hypothetical protein
MALLASATKLILRRRLPTLLRSLQQPVQSQAETLNQLLRGAAGTQWGQQHRYSLLRTFQDYQKQVPISTYDQLLPWIEKMMAGESNVLWPGSVQWYSKSSGTTQRSKFIPMTDASLHLNHFKVGRDMGALYFAQRPQSRLFEGKALTVGGSLAHSHPQQDVRSGDLSAVLIERLPRWYQRWRTPPREIALLHDWEQKLDAMAHLLLHESVTNLHGVPSWTLVLLQRLLDKKGAAHLREVWPQLEVFFHGGVSLAPYRTRLQRLAEGLDLALMETYNASEGFFAVQDDLRRDDLALMVRHGIFFEFLPLEELGQAQPRTLGVEEVEVGRTYALVISTSGGLWRYLIGDTVQVSSKVPLRIRVAGRTQQHLNVFGEEVMVHNTDAALAAAAKQHRCEVKDYTVAPFVQECHPSGWHQWLVEFALPPQNLEAFAQDLDAALRRVNSDYDAKREGNFVLGPAQVVMARPGVFDEWLGRKGQLGGQHKVPRLSEHRKVLDELLGINAQA